MNEGQIRELIRANSRTLRRGWLCPSDNQLAAYVVDQLEAKQRAALESHAADCAACMSALAFLAQSAEWPVSDEIPPALLYKAKNIVNKSSPTVWPQRWALASAIAGCVALVFLLIALRFRSEPLPTNPGADLVAQNQGAQIPTPTAAPSVELPRPTPSAQTQKRGVRDVISPVVRGEQKSLRPFLLSPREGTVLKRGQMLFSWKAVPDAISYEVRIAQDDGSLVSADKTNGTKLIRNADNLKAGKYFVTIFAHLPDGRTEKSDMVSFRLARP
jgi:hypothetical protein